MIRPPTPAASFPRRAAPAGRGLPLGISTGRGGRGDRRQADTAQPEDGGTLARPQSGTPHDSSAARHDRAPDDGGDIRSQVVGQVHGGRFVEDAVLAEGEDNGGLGLVTIRQLDTG